MKSALLAVLLFFSFADQGSASSLCTEKITSYRSILDCAETRSPEVQTALLELEKAKASVRAAEQWKNPEISIGNVQGKSGDKNESDLSLSFPVELGGKISARRTAAEGGVAFAESNLDTAKVKVRSQTLLKLHRLRQVLHEQDVVDEAIATFSKLLAQYAARPNLSPEQQISSTVFQLSKNDYILKKILADDEVAALNSYFLVIIGMGLDEIRKSLPEIPQDWPTINRENRDLNSPRLKNLQAELKTAVAELSVARSEAWPTLMIGPSVKLQNESGQTNQLLGFNLSMPLPIFNTNGGAKAAALSSVKLTESKKALAYAEQTHMRNELIQVYERSIKFLKVGLSKKEMARRHDEAELLFARGIVSSSLVIETHRTLFELEKSRNERELKAIESLLEINALDGISTEVSL